MAAIGRLDAVNLGFTSIAYDPEAHYQEVRRKPWGTSITHSDGRIEQLPATESVK
jgi:outer membrane protein